MKLPRHAQIWAPGYIQERISRLLPSQPPPKRVWLTLADHFEPMWHGADMATAAARVALWHSQWPQIASRVGGDSAGNPPRYTFFYAEEEYRREFLDQLADLHHRRIADVELHIHHNGDGRQNFIDRITKFCHTLRHEHRLLHMWNGKTAFGFIHGNWALDNSLSGGRWCGLNGEAQLLRDLGCYADFTMPSGDSETQSRIVNQIYWCTGDPMRPKSYDTGRRVAVGAATNGHLLMIPGPFGLRWAGRLMPRMETGELAANDLPTRYRAKRWVNLAPRIGSDVFIKLYTHGAQERNSSALLGGALQTTFEMVRYQAEKVRSSVFFVTAWEMFLAIEAIREGRDPVAEIANSEQILTTYRNDALPGRTEVGFSALLAEKRDSNQEVVVALDHRYCPVNRLQTAFRAFKNLRAAGRPIRLVVIGNEPLNISGGGNGDITVADTPSTPEGFQHFDIFVSLAAGFPNAVLQAMQAGCAVIAAVEGKAPHVSPDCHIAGLVQPGDVPGMQRMLADLIDNKSKRRALANKAQRVVSRQYSATGLWHTYNGSPPESIGYSRDRLKEALYLCVPKRLLVSRSGANRPEFALTIDDGPDPHYTPQILKILRSYGARATFFIVGNCAEQHKKLVEQIAADGHEIGNHSYTHPYFHRLSWREAHRELSASTRILGQQGLTTRMFRPPFANLSLRTMLSAWTHGYTVVMASVDLKDYLATHASEIEARLDQRPLAAGDIVMYHGTCTAAICALPHVLQSGLDRGLKPVELSKLLR